MKLSEDQQLVFDEILDWAVATCNRRDSDPEETPGDFLETLFKAKKNKSSMYAGNAPSKTLAGLAGTGKTTLAAELIKALREKGIYTSLMAFTGRAALVLGHKCEAIGAYPVSYSTIHRFLYRPISVDGKMRWVRVDPEQLMQICDLIIVDEASMVPQKIWADLKSIGIPILFVGDHGQLPPVEGNGFNVMDEPDWRLEKIHRQAEDSPIIQLAHEVREGHELRPRLVEDKLLVTAKRSKVGVSVMNSYMTDRGKDPDAILLCGMNWTRVNLNKRCRKSLGFTTDLPVAGEKVVCLRNDTELGIMNGYMGTTVSVGHTNGRGLFDMAVDFGSETINLDYCHPDVFNEPNAGAVMKEIGWRNLKGIGVFDYGYAVSVHKAQGSEWPTVMLFTERTKYQSDEDYRRWLYTGITRAKDKLVVLI